MLRKNFEERNEHLQKFAGQLPHSARLDRGWRLEELRITDSRERNTENTSSDNEGRSRSMLENSDVATRLPARDLNRARRFYAEKLGLEPVEERPGGLRYRSGNTFFVLFQSAGESSGSHTQMGWEVADIEATMSALRARGVVFEEYDLPGLETANGIAEITGNYPSKGIGEKGAWFKDSEGNLLGIGQPLR
jgi:catechol 2,3-dioxygenase-like lactoylglutathione lyase family enzyme